jgi:glycosidase
VLLLSAPIRVPVTAMKRNRTVALLLTLLCLLALPSLSQPASKAAAGTPTINKIDPPNWWLNFTPDVTLLLTGDNLKGAHVESKSADASVVGSQGSANGHYLFVHLRLKTQLRSQIKTRIKTKLGSSAPKVAKINLRVVTAGGAATLQFPLLPRDETRGDFEGFNRDDVIYLIMPDRFADGDPSNDQPTGSTGTYDRSNPSVYHGGDLRGVDEHLSYLHDLGVTTIWLTPAWKNTDSDYHGYHVVDFYALDEHMGTMEDYQTLVAVAHKMGMKVLIDYVANHTGPKHPWATDPPTPTWLHGTSEQHLAPSYSFNGLVDPHAPPKQWRATIEGWFANKLPDLNPDDPQLGLYLAQNAMWWTESAQLDGFRLDTFPYSSREFWSGWHTRIFKVYPHINDIGEVADPNPVITSFFEGGKKQYDGIDSGVTTVFDFPLCDALRAVIIKGDPIYRIVDVLRADELFPHPEMMVTFIGNHDDRRFVSENGSDTKKLKAAFSLLLTLRGIPQIYAGDEIGMQGGEDPDNRRDFPGGFPGDTQNAFTAKGRTPEQQDVFAHVQSLLALRQKHSALRTGKQWHIGWDGTYYAFVRESADEKLLVIYNNATQPRALEIPVDDTPLESARQLEPIFGNSNAEVKQGKIQVSVPAQSIAIFNAR